MCVFSLHYLAFHLADGNEAGPPAYFSLGVVFGVSLVHICNRVVQDNKCRLLRNTHEKVVRNPCIMCDVEA